MYIYTGCVAVTQIQIRTRTNAGKLIDWTLKFSLNAVGTSGNFPARYGQELYIVCPSSFLLPLPSLSTCTLLPLVPPLYLYPPSSRPSSLLVPSFLSSLPPPPPLFSSLTHTYSIYEHSSVFALVWSGGPSIPVHPYKDCQHFSLLHVGQ